MRGVGVGVTAAIGAEHLDRDLRSHRTLHDGLGIGDLLLDHDRLAVGAFHRLALVIHLRDLRRERLGQRWRSRYGLKFWIMPCETRTIAKTTQIGRSR